MTAGKLTYDGLYRQMKEKISEREPDNAANEAVWLFEHLSGGNGRAWLLQNGGFEADAELASRCLELSDRRRNGEPLQYLLGLWEFFGLELLVGPGVLIPRPETELLVELVLGHIKPAPEPLVLDLCSGTGCIPIALAHAHPGCRAWGVELYEEAYRYFSQNVQLTGQQQTVTPLRGDAFAPPTEATSRRYNAVTSNPPYIDADEMETLPEEVCHEPVTALLGGADGLDFYRKLPTLAASLLLPGGLLALEIGEKQGADVSHLMQEAGFTSVTVHKDLSGLDRVVTGIMP